jgi:hypothetical protein
LILLCYFLKIYLFLQVFLNILILKQISCAPKNVLFQKFFFHSNIRLLHLILQNLRLCWNHLLKELLNRFLIYILNIFFSLFMVLLFLLFLYLIFLDLLSFLFCFIKIIVKFMYILINLKRLKFFILYSFFYYYYFYLVIFFLVFYFFFCLYFYFLFFFYAFLSNLFKIFFRFL